MAFDDGGTPPFAGGTWYVDGGARRVDPDGSQGINCVFRRGTCPTRRYGCWVAALLTAGGHRWRLSTDSFGCASSGCESGRDDVVRCEPRCLEGCHGRNMQYMNDASSLGRERRGSRYPDRSKSLLPPHVANLFPAPSVCHPDKFPHLPLYINFFQLADPGTRLSPREQASIESHHQGRYSPHNTLKFG